MRNRREPNERETGRQEKQAQGNAVQQGKDSRSAGLQRMMRQLEQGPGEEASQAVKKRRICAYLSCMVPPDV